MDNNQMSSADHIIEHLNAVNVDGEMLEYIINKTFMRNQMLQQLIMSATDLEIYSILSERDSVHDRGRNSF